MANMIGAYRARDALEMLAIVHGMSWDQLTEQPVTVGNININSPRQVDDAMSDALIEFALAGQPVLVTPFTLLGAMAPTTMAGAIGSAKCRSTGLHGPDSGRQSRIPHSSTEAFQAMWT